MQQFEIATVPVEHAVYPPFVDRDGKLITVEQGQAMRKQIQQWPYWEYIGAVAKKEYALSEERYRELLPEFQKFMCLIVLGINGLGMFDVEIDNIWHSFILATLRYRQFCERFNRGEMIHHLPQLEEKRNNICTVCKSCKNCSAPHLVPSETSDDPNYFAQAYVQAFGEIPSPLWKLGRFSKYLRPEYLC